MNRIRKLLQRTLKLLCLFNLMSCSSPPLRQWQIEEVRTSCSHFNSGRLLLPPSEECEYVELELVRNCSGLRFYLNLFFSQIRPLQEDLLKTSLEVHYDNCPAPFIMYPYLMEGGQRILLEKKDAEQLINCLKDNQSFILKLGRHEIEIVATKFAEHYQTLINFPID